MIAKRDDLSSKLRFTSKCGKRFLEVFKNAVSDDGGLSNSCRRTLIASSHLGVLEEAESQKTNGLDRADHVVDPDVLAGIIVRVSRLIISGKRFDENVTRGHLRVGAEVLAEAEVVSERIRSKLVLLEEKQRSDENFPLFLTTYAEAIGQAAEGVSEKEVDSHVVAALSQLVGRRVST